MEAVEQKGATAPATDETPEEGRPAARILYERDEASFSCEPGVPVLDSALDQGVDMDHGCRVGACGACAVEVVEGLENADAPDAIEEDTRARCDLGPSVRLACRMTCRGPMRLRPLDD